MDLIDLPRSERRYEGDTGDYPTCIICGRPIRAKTPKYLHIVGGGLQVLSPVDDAEYRDAGDNPGDMYYHPVGAGCLKRHPQLKPYVHLRAGSAAISQ